MKPIIVWGVCYAVFRRELLLTMRRSSNYLNPLFFFVVMFTMFAFALGPDPALFRHAAPAIVWSGVLLASILSLEGLFRADFEDGTLEQILLSPYPLTMLVVVKIAVHWLFSGLAMIAVVALMGGLHAVPRDMLIVLLATLALATPVLSLIGAVGAALTVGLRGGGPLPALLILPLCVPILIFATGAVYNAAAGLPVKAELYFLTGVLVLSLTLAPPAVAASLRIHAG